MRPVVLTDVHLAARLVRSGLLKYYSPEQLQFLISDIGFDYNYPQTVYNQHDKSFAERMRKQGFLRVKSFDDIQMTRMYALFRQFKPKFTIRIVSALLLAQMTNSTLISEDEVLRDVAPMCMISAHNKQWLVSQLVHELAFQGITLDVELVNELI
ncbi:hypothetical protein [Fibrella arboris]|uniref:hypothetical protein n=1 Tax=Fibrella arboris TaxID=3242486 RepID=UPI0035200686